MLTTLLTSLQTTLTASKAFVLAGLLPVTLFALASGVLLYRVHPGFAKWVFSADASRIQVVTLTALLWLASAYVLSALGPTLLEALEGKHPPLSWLRRSLHARHWKRRRDLWTRYLDCAREEGQFQCCAKKWKDYLSEARRRGACLGRCDDNAEAAPRAAAVIGKTRRGGSVSTEEMAAAVNEFGAVLARNSAELEDSSCAARLAERHRELLDCIDYAWAGQRFDRIRHFNLLQFRYPGPFDDADAPSSTISLAPTAIGNVGRTSRSYALSRYSLDLDIFWTRLQKTIRSSKEFHDGLQDAKILVDCLVAMTWLAALFVVGWAFALPWIAKSTSEFLLVTIGGPLLTLGLYELACRGYVVFADLLRSAVDLYRLDLLKDLHIPLPYGSAEERRIWEELGRLAGYGSPRPIIYQHPSGR